MEPRHARAIVQFQPIGRRARALEFLPPANMSLRPLVGIVSIEVPFGVWIEKDSAPAFQTQFACPWNIDKAWRQARDFKKSFDEVHELRNSLSSPSTVRRRAVSI
jgi:hypothetical protein